MVTRLQPCHVFADLAHDTCALVTSDAGQPQRHISSDQMLIGVADSRGVDLDEYLGRLRRIQFDRFDRPWLPAFAENGGLCAACVCTLRSLLRMLLAAESAMTITRLVDPILASLYCYHN